MCTGRVDLAFILRALMVGSDGVFVGGCRPGECHYSTEGNYHALSMTHIARKLLEAIGVNPRRLRLEWISASQGIRFAELMNDFAGEVKALGPLGRGEGLDEKLLKSGLETVNRLIPYIRLVERERLRVRFDTEKEYEEFFSSDEVNGIFSELIGDKLAVSEILSALREKPLSTGEISELLGSSASEVSRLIAASVRQGFVRFDEGCKRYAPA